ncbi:uncharacterized protein LJ206_016133 isoform 1-T2 [Theristicus caerulescens]
MLQRRFQNCPDEMQHEEDVLLTPQEATNEHFLVTKGRHPGRHLEALKGKYELCRGATIAFLDQVSSHVLAWFNKHFFASISVSQKTLYFCTHTRAAGFSFQRITALWKGSTSGLFPHDLSTATG